MALGIEAFIRVNSDDNSSSSADHLYLSGSTLSFDHAGRTVRLQDITAVWYRKGSHWLCNRFNDVDATSSRALDELLRKRISKEEVRLSEYFHFLLRSATPSLGSSDAVQLNKLVALHAAQQVGLLVPAFHISSSREELMRFASESQYITKAISDIVFLFDRNDNDRAFVSYTELVSASAIATLPSTLAPSLIQRKIEKQFDARVFYLNGQCSAMAILSQRDAQTAVDFRKYNYEKPNRSIPLRLPTDIEEKLHLLFILLGLNTGSADFIVDTSGEFFFLEINPVGQFSMVSHPCNYYLEKQVAAALISMSRKAMETHEPKGLV